MRRTFVVFSLIGSLVVGVHSTAASAAGGTGALTLLSTSGSGAKADHGVAALFSMSGDGSKVAFTSPSGNLVSPPPPGGPSEIYVKDTASGLVQLASSAADGTPANGESGQQALSHNGRFVSFVSNATNLSPGDTDTASDLYVKDLLTGALTVASTNSSGVKGNQSFIGGFPAVSDDGTRVVFVANGSNFDLRQTAKTCTSPHGPYNCTESEFYVKDLSTGATTLLSLGDDGRNALGGTIAEGISSDGTKVIIATSDALVPEDVDGNRSDVYLIDLAAGTTTLVSTQYTPGTPDADLVSAYFPYTDAAADRVVFQGEGVVAPWSPDGTTPQIDAFVKDLRTGRLSVASTTTDGTRGNDLSQDPEISADGRYVSFSSNATNLDPADDNGVADIFLKDLDTGELRLASQRDDGTLSDNYAFISAPVAGSGDVAFVTAATNLDPADNDSYEDLYLKRWPVVSADANGDGIADSLQPSGTATGSFLDDGTSPATFGSIVNAAGLAVTITDAPDAIDGVQIAVGPGTGRATISACGFTHRFSANSVAVISCGSTIVNTTSGDVEVVLDAGGTIVTIPAGASAEVAAGVGGHGASVSNVVGGDVSVVVEGVTRSIAPGDPPVDVAPPTPPVVVPTITGTVGTNGWYVSPVSVNWSVTDPESPVTSSTGCALTTISTDVAAMTLTCQATSAGGTTSASTGTIKVDRTAPVLSFATHPASYGVDETVVIGCTATDALSGIATTCTPVNAPASSFAVGTSTVSTSATDLAGNRGTATTSVTVQVTPAGLCALTTQVVQGSARYKAVVAGQRAAANALVNVACGDLDGITAKANAKQKAALVAAYVAGLTPLVQQGWLTGAQANLLSSVASKL